MVAQNLQAIQPEKQVLATPVALQNADVWKMQHAHMAAALSFILTEMKRIHAQAKDFEPLDKPTKSQGLLPPLSPQLRKDLLAYLEAMELLQQDEKKLLEMAKHLSHMKNAMYGVMEIMNMFQNIDGAKISALSALDNVDSDIRTQITGAEGEVNAMSGEKSTGKPGHDPTKKEVEQAKKLVAFINSIQAFLEQEGGNSKIMGKGTLSNLEDAIKNIKGVFKSSWGNPKEMAERMNEWIAGSKKGKFSPELKDLQFGLQQANQTVSALSTSTNTQLEFVTNMFKQFLGVDESAMQAYQKGNLTMIQNQRSN
jgi:hypothetical protein